VYRLHITKIIEDYLYLYCTTMRVYAYLRASKKEQEGLRAKKALFEFAENFK